MVCGKYFEIFVASVSLLFACKEPQVIQCTCCNVENLKEFWREKKHTENVPSLKGNPRVGTNKDFWDIWYECCCLSLKSLVWDDFTPEKNTQMFIKSLFLDLPDLFKRNPEVMAPNPLALGLPLHPPSIFKELALCYLFSILVFSARLKALRLSFTCLVQGSKEGLSLLFTAQKDQKQQRGERGSTLEKSTPSFPIY